MTPAKVTRGPLIDGDLRDPCWKGAREYAGLVTLQTHEPARPLTKFKVLYDDRRLYFGIECAEPNMAGLAANVAEDDNGRIWADDAVEIFLDPAGRKDDDYHFILNTRGARFDEKVTHGGGMVVWDADWDVGIKKRKSSWTAEVAIPFYSLEIIPRVTPTSWRFNIVRSRRAGKKHTLTTFAPLQLSYHEPDRYVPLGPIQVDFSRFCYDVGKPVRRSVMKAGILETAVEIPVTNRTGAHREVTVEGWLAGPGGKVLVRSRDLRLKTGQSESVRIAGFPLEEQGDYTFHLLVQDDAPRHLSAYPMQIVFVPLEIILDEPSYRATIFASQDLRNIRLRVRIVLSAEDLKNFRLRVSLQSKDGRRIAAKEVTPLTSETVPVLLPCADLPTGDYAIEAALTSAAGKTTAQTTHELHKLPPPARGSEVRVDSNLNLIVNGRPIFPIGWYGGAAPAAAQREGYNVLYVGSTLYIPAQEVLKKWDEYHKHGIMVFTDPAPSTKLWVKHSSYTPEEKQRVIDLVNAIKDHPAHLGWYMADEPESSGWPLANLKERYDLLRTLDPYHPCIILNNSVQGLYSYVTATDILWPDPYPMFLRKGGSARPITRVPLFIDKGYEASGARKPMWVCPEAFDWSRTSGRIEQAPPTFAQQRCQTWLAINHGVKGIVYFGRSHARNDPDLIHSIPYLAREINRLSGVLLHGQRRSLTVKPAQSMDAAAWTYQDHVYVAATNHTTRPVSAEIDLQGLRAGPYTVIAGNRTVRSADGKSIRDRFEPYAVHLYTTAPTDRDPPTIQEMLRRIEAFRAGLRKKRNVAFGGKVTASVLRRGTMHECIVDGIYYPPEEDFSYGWRAAQKRPAWCQVQFDERARINKVVVIGRDLPEYDVQCWRAGQWKTVAEGRGKEPFRRSHTFDPVTTDRVRLAIGRGPRTHIITEVEAYQVAKDARTR